MKGWGTQAHITAESLSLVTVRSAKSPRLTSPPDSVHDENV